MSQFNRPTAPKQSYPTSYYQLTNERQRWEPSTSPTLPPFGQQGWPTSTSQAFGSSSSYPYHSSQSSREAHEYRQSHSFSPINCSPEFYSVDRQSNNPYPSPTFSSPQLNGEQQLAGPSNGNFRERQQQLTQYNEVRNSPPLRHEPYRRIDSRQEQETQRERVNIKDGPIRPFVSKVAYLLKTPEKFGEAIRWDPLGTTFLLTLGSPVLFEMLTEMFSHRSLAAFSHQLNTYGFQRLTAAQLAQRFNMEPDPRLLKEYSAWQHLHFDSSFTSLNRLLPKPSRARFTARKEKAMRILMGSNNSEYDGRYEQ